MNRNFFWLSFHKLSSMAAQAAAYSCTKARSFEKKVGQDLKKNRNRNTRTGRDQNLFFIKIGWEFFFSEGERAPSKVPWRYHEAKVPPRYLTRYIARYLEAKVPPRYLTRYLTRYLEAKIPPRYFEAKVPPRYLGRRYLARYLEASSKVPYKVHCKVRSMYLGAQGTFKVPWVGVC